MRLYQREGYRKAFESTVLEVRPADRTAHEETGWVRLEDTLFYPTSGGQPHDTGALGEAEVTDVNVAGGAVWHRLKGPLPEVGQRVSGTLDWPRRYRHMQRHSAQHLLSQAFVQVDPTFETRAVSLSGPVCTLDLAGAPGAEDVERAETVALEAMYAGLTVTAFEVDEADLPRYPLRRPPKVSGRVRLVKMGDFELSACGGTHLRRTSEALPLKVLGQGRIRGVLTRVHFTAGWEAQADYGLKHRLVTDLAGSFSAHVTDVPVRVGALQAALRERERDLEAAKVRLAQGLADHLAAHRTGNVVQHVLAEGEADLLEPLAQRLVAQGVTALLGAEGERAQLLFMQPEGGNGNMREALASALPFVDGRGGGSSGRAQGGGPNAAGLGAALAAAAASLGAA